MDDKVKKKIDDFFTQYKRQTYKKREILIRADDFPQGVYYLIKGVVKMYAISKKGDELVLNIFKPISFFPMSWAINNTNNPYFYEAMTAVEVFRAPREEAIQFIKNNPDVLYNLMTRVFHGTDGILTRMSYLMSGSAYERIIVEILINAKRFGTQNNKESTSININETDLANQAGMTRETISRELKILKDRNLIRYNKGELTIPNFQKLEDELT